MAGMQEQMTTEELAENQRIRRRREGPTKLGFFLRLNAGLILTAVGIAIFKAPNHFALGGTSGISIVLSTLFPTFPVSTFMWFVNLLLVILGLVFLDVRTMGWTVYSSFALSAYVTVLERLVPLSAPLTQDMLLELIFAVMLPAVGSAIVFDIGASTGGTDILAMILKRKTSLEIGKALLASDAAIVAIAAVLYGPEVGLYCVLGLVAKAFMVDGVIDSIHTRKVCTVISKKPDDILWFVVKELHRTATIRDAHGGFSGQPVTELVCVLSRSEAAKLRNHLRKTDPGAFLTIVSSSEILGRGFRGI